MPNRKDVVRCFDKPWQGGKKLRKMRSMLMNHPEDYHEIQGNSLYPRNENTSSHDKQQQKMMSSPTWLTMPSQEYVGVTRQEHKAIQNVNHTHYPLHNVSNRHVKKVSFGQVSIIPVK